MQLMTTTMKSARFISGRLKIDEIEHNNEVDTIALEWVKNARNVSPYESWSG